MLKIDTYNTFNTQIELLPRLTIIYNDEVFESKGIAFEFLFFGVYIYCE